MTIRNMYPSDDAAGSGPDGVSDEDSWSERRFLGIDSAGETRDGSVEAKDEAEDEDMVRGREDGAGPHSTRPHPAVRCYRCLARQSRERPRLFALVFRVAMPLLSLIGLSLVFGYWLATEEELAEKQRNNAAIAMREMLLASSQVESVVVKEGPPFCAGLYLADRSGRIDVDVDGLEDVVLNELDRVYGEVFAALYQEDAEYPARNDTRYHNLTLANDTNLNEKNTIDDARGFMDFITKCGEELDKLLAYTSVSTIIDRIESNGIDFTTITFNWIKCPPGHNLTAEHNFTYMSYDMRESWRMFTELLVTPDAQAQELAVVESWRKDFIGLFDGYYSLYRNQSNMTQLQARNKALSEAVHEANGFQECVPDIASSAWFWFVVMTTIGYGNAAPSSMVGRAMVYTFGFMCILCFAAVLGTAGGVVTAIFDDAVGRNKRIAWLGVTWVQTVFWAICTYTWMLVVAGVRMWWRRSRLGETEDLAVAYWFAYISITTVGLGDYFIDSKSITNFDVVLFAALFLMGFVLWANFACKMTELLCSLSVVLDGVAFRALLKENASLPTAPQDSKK